MQSYAEALAFCNHPAAGPNRLPGARSFQFGLASAPIASQTVQTIRGPNEGTATSSG
jgi:hypothetical protein